MTVFAPNSRNNFDLVRTILALMVLLSHSATLSAAPEIAWMRWFFDSDFAIKGFFAISGFLVMKSLTSSGSLLEYTEKRARRIYPAYLSAIALCFLIGLAMTSLDAYAFLTSPQTWHYLAVNSVFLNFLQHDLPGVFTENPMSEMNGALWTIKVEVALYAGLPIIALFFRWWGVALTGALIIVASIFWVYVFGYVIEGGFGQLLARQFPGQAVYFVAGACLYLRPKWRDPLPYIAAISLLPYLFSRSTIFEPILEPVFVVSSIIFLSDRALPALGAGRFGDLSYGVYLYHFPIIQLLIALGVFALNPWLGLVATLVCTLALAFLSWHFIEARVLKRSSHYVQETQKRRG
ncbi:MAG: acyltransferase [Alphaproteobacteria bacterium]|nr:acyltransferase [Alphaproteobacteria bacterium]